MSNSNDCTVTPIQKKENVIDYGVLDASKKNRAPLISPEKIFEVKYSECYGNSYSTEELKCLAIFDILAYDILTEKQLVEIQKNIDTLKNLSFEDIDKKRTEAIMKNKIYTEPEYKLTSYHFLKNNKLNAVYEHKGEYDAFIMQLKNNNIQDTIVEYNKKIKKFKEEKSFSPRDWTVKKTILEQILKKEN